MAGMSIRRDPVRHPIRTEGRILKTEQRHETRPVPADCRKRASSACATSFWFSPNAMTSVRHRSVRLGRRLRHLLDSREQLTGIPLTQRMMDSPQPSRTFVDFWTSAYQPSATTAPAPGNYLGNNSMSDVGVAKPDSSST
jgi:hypothetical protein